MNQPKVTSDLKQLAKDIRNLAQSLLDDSITGKIIRRVGAHVNFTPEEEEVVYNFANSANFLRKFEQEKPPAFLEKYNKYYYGPNNWKIRANIDVAIGTSRRICEGKFSSVDDTMVATLIRDNMVLFETKYTEVQLREIDFEDFHRILIEYMEIPELPDLLREWGKANCEEDSAYEQFGYANAPSHKIMRRYGLVRGASFAHMADHIFINNLDYNNADVVREAAVGLNRNFTHIRGIDNG